MAHAVKNQKFLELSFGVPAFFDKSVAGRPRCVGRHLVPDTIVSRFVGVAFAGNTFPMMTGIRAIRSGAVALILFALLK